MQGNEIYIRPASDYLQEDGEQLSFYQLMARARQSKEIVFAYKLAHAEKAVINPADKNVPRAWSFHDSLVTISED